MKYFFLVVSVTPNNCSTSIIYNVSLRGEESLSKFITRNKLKGKVNYFDFVVLQLTEVSAETYKIMARHNPRRDGCYITLV